MYIKEGRSRGAVEVRVGKSHYGFPLLLRTKAHGRTPGNSGSMRRERRKNLKGRVLLVGSQNVYAIPQ